MILCKTIVLDCAQQVVQMLYIIIIFIKCINTIIIIISPLNNLEVIAIFLDISFENQYFFAWFTALRRVFTDPLTPCILDQPHSFTWPAAFGLSSSWPIKSFSFHLFILILPTFQSLPQIFSFLQFHWTDLNILSW